MTYDGQAPSARSLAVRNLSKWYGDYQAVCPTDWQLDGGEFYALLGQSGSGKTTTLMMVAGLVKPTSGAILVGGQDVTRLPPDRRNLGMVFQDYALFPHMTVRENVAYGLRMRRHSRKSAATRIDAVLETVGLQRYGHRRPAELSGGQRQRVALARSIVYEPPVLLMDEPLGALDKSLREQLQLELRRLHRQLGITVLYVTHDQREALTMADRIAVMRDGKIEQDAAPEVIYHRPCSVFVAGFLGDCSFLRPSSVRKLTANQYEVDVTGFRGAVTVTAGGDDSDGGDPSVALRPHEMTISAAGGPGLAGRVTDRVFEGGTYEYVVAVQDNSPVVVRSDALSETRFDIGDQVTVGWSWADARLLC